MPVIDVYGSMIREKHVAMHSIRSRHTTLVRGRGALKVSSIRNLVVQRPIRAAYRLNGTVVKGTARQWGTEGHVPDCVPSTVEIQPLVDVVGEGAAWGGYLSGHYGHFLTETVARLWPMVPGEKLADTQVVFVAPNNVPGFVIEWLSAFGAIKRQLPKQGASLFRCLQVPDPAWQLNAWVSPEIRDVHLHARQHMSIPSHDTPEVVWLSRSGLAGERIAHDERLLELLIGDQATIVHPERLSLSEQIATMEDSRVVAGIVGSAFHTLLLTRKAPDCLYLCPPVIASAYEAQSRLLRSRSDFWLGMDRMPMAGAKRFPGNHRVMIPQALNALMSSHVVPGLGASAGVAPILGPAPRTPREITLRHGSQSAVIAAVAHYPFSKPARRRLMALFEDDGRTELAEEQRRALTAISDAA